MIERLVLASSDEGDLILDPFSGSGTTLRVCQQVNRSCIGIEKNPEYVQMTMDRLETPFKGFDGIDPRITRVPNDLNDPDIRREYFYNHIQWFLNNHDDEIDGFIEKFKTKYPEFDIPPEFSKDSQLTFL